MKQLVLTKWLLKEEMQGLILFVQSMEEMLFHFNTHSKKVHATNVRTLAFEAKKMLDRVKREKIKISSLLPIIEEIKTSLLTDPVAKELLGLKEDFIIKKLNITGDLDEMENSIDAMLRHLGNNRYLTETKNQLSKVVKNPKEKRMIIKLTRIFASELLNLGYDKQYMYFSLKNLFITPQDEVSSPENIVKYFGLFDGNKQKFKVLRLVNKDYKLFKHILKPLHIDSMKDEKPETNLIPKEKAFYDNKKPYEVIIESHIEALDHFSAAKISNNRLTLMASVNTFYSHNKKLKWNKWALVYDTDGNVQSIRPSIHLMETRPNMKADDVLKHIILTLSGTGLSEESSLRLRRVMTLHGSAMKTEIKQNQLLNLWSAIETLFPVPKNEKSRINYLISCINPILRKIYIYNLFQEFYIDITRIIPELKLDDIAGSTNIERFLALVCLDDYKNERAERLYNMVGHLNPLAVNRIFELKTNFSHPKEILRNIEKHQQKVAWQLHRIYRCRNEIVHSGDYHMPFLSILIESLHYYVDVIIEYVQNVIKSGINVRNFEAIVYDCIIDNNYHNSILKKEAETKINRENFQTLILGCKT